MIEFALDLIEICLQWDTKSAQWDFQDWAKTTEEGLKKKKVEFSTFGSGLPPPKKKNAKEVSFSETRPFF